MKLKVIITGATGMVGKGVLYECIDDENITEILMVNRTHIGIEHPKLKEILHQNFFDLAPIQERLQGYDACFFCLGVSSFRMSEAEYYKLTYELTTTFAHAVVNPNMVFAYVSGTGTDTTEEGGSMWARVKGKTENALLAMPFKAAYMFRPGMILPVRGIKSKTKLYSILYTILSPFFPLLKNLPSVTDTTKVGKAMINVALHGSDKTYIENVDINELVK